jgi:hypothetical protein
MALKNGCVERASKELDACGALPRGTYLNRHSLRAAIVSNRAGKGPDLVKPGHACRAGILEVRARRYVVVLGAPSARRVASASSNSR